MIQKLRSGPRRRTESPMNNQSPQNESRARIGFVDAVAEFVAPVLLSKGFICIHSSVDSVVYESVKVRVDVLHDALSDEIEVYLSLKTAPALKISLRDFVSAKIGPLPEPGIFFQSRTHRGVSAALSSLAGLLGQYGQGALSGRAAAFEEVDASRRVEAAKLTALYETSQTRDAVREAWERRDYPSVRKLLESIATLNPDEKRKLAYAKRRLDEKN